MKRSDYGKTPKAGHVGARNVIPDSDQKKENKKKRISQDAEELFFRCLYILACIIAFIFFYLTLSGSM